MNKIKSQTYPFRPSPEQVKLYDKIASELGKTINVLSEILSIPKSEFRLSLDGLWDGYSRDNKRDKGLTVQIKPSDTSWKEAWTGNNYILQSLSGEGVLISNGRFGDNVRIDGNRNIKVREIFNRVLDNGDIEQIVSEENTRIVNLLTEEELSLIAPNTPIVVTGY